MLKSPKTADLGTDKKSSSEPLTSGNVTYEGCLVCKAAVAEGKASMETVELSYFYTSNMPMYIVHTNVCLWQVYFYWIYSFKNL